MKSELSQPWNLFICTSKLRNSSTQKVAYKLEILHIFTYHARHAFYQKKYHKYIVTLEAANKYSVCSFLAKTIK